MCGCLRQKLSHLQDNPVAADGPDRPSGPDRPIHPYQPLEWFVKEMEGKLNELGQRISAIEKAQLQNKKMIFKEKFTKE